MRIGIITAQFNDDITKKMNKAAIEQAKKYNLKITENIQVPGAYDTPYAAKVLIERQSVDAIAVLGAIIVGETEHDEVIAHAIATSLSALSTQYSIPISLGIIGPGASEEQAKERAEDYARRAVDAAVALRKLKEF